MFNNNIVKFALYLAGLSTNDQQYLGEKKILVILEGGVWGWKNKTFTGPEQNAYEINWQLEKVPYYKTQ